MSGRVRRACPDDLAVLASLDPWPTREAWDSRLRDGMILVLEQDRRIVGFLRWVALWTTAPFLELIEIAPEARGARGSRELLEVRMADLRGRGYAARLSSAQSDDHRAQAWRRHLGFEDGGVIENVADDGVHEQVFRRLL